MGDTLFIVNPGASGGQGELAWHRFRELWPETIDSADVRVTEHPGHGTEIAASAWGYNILGVVGGDGSVNEVCNGLLRREGDRPALAIIPPAPATTSHAPTTSSPWRMPSRHYAPGLSAPTTSSAATAGKVIAPSPRTACFRATSVFLAPL